MNKLIALIAVFVVFIYLIIPAEVAASNAKDYDLDISATIFPNQFWVTEINMTGHMWVSINLSTNGQIADVYFMNAQEFTAFNASVNQGSGTFTYNHHLSQQHVLTYYAGAEVNEVGIHYLVVSNVDGASSISITGHLGTMQIESVWDSGLLWAIVIVVIVAVGLMLFALVFGRARKKS